MNNDYFVFPDKLNLVEKIKYEQIKLKLEENTVGQTKEQLELNIPLLFWLNPEPKLSIPMYYGPHGFVDFRREITVREKFQYLIFIYGFIKYKSI